MLACLQQIVCAGRRRKNAVASCSKLGNWARQICRGCWRSRLPMVVPDVCSLSAWACLWQVQSYAGDSVLVFAREGRQCRPACVTMARTRVRKLQVCTRSVHLCVINNLTPKVSENNRSRPLMLHVGCGKWERFSQWSQTIALHSGCRSDYSDSFIGFRGLLDWRTTVWHIAHAVSCQWFNILLLRRQRWMLVRCGRCAWCVHDLAMLLPFWGLCAWCWRLVLCHIASGHMVQLPVQGGSDSTSSNCTLGFLVHVKFPCLMVISRQLPIRLNQWYKPIVW